MMTETAENQMSSSSSFCIFHYSLCYVAVIVHFIVLTVFSSSSLSLILSFPVLILSTLLLFKIKKEKPSFEENTNNLVVIKDESLQKSQLEFEEIFLEPELENEVLEPNKIVTQVGYLLAKSSDIPSETESGDLSWSSEDSDVDWSFRHYVGQAPIFSDGSISDDDSLIEIELLGGHYIGAQEEPNFSFCTKEEPKFGFGAKVEETKFMEYQKNLPELFQESIFGKEDLMELLTDINEMNEEENLIEIDISMGSIKCSRSQILA